MPQHFPDLPPLVPQRGTAYSRALCKKLFLGQGWTVVGEIPNLPKAVAIISPHTSNIDGWYGFLAIGGLGLKITVLGKDTLFKPALKPLLNWAGLIPVHRDSAHGLTEQVVTTIHQHDKIWIGMAPEGTRKKAEKMKSGFYHIAHAAGIPIVMFAFDYDHKTIYCLGAFTPTGHYQQDLEHIMQRYVGHFSPKNPDWLAEPLQKLVKKN
ncbi:1-acyl-sn-glycerol-3-phosphate acyltransferase [Acinetobacter higginsii]|uniref:1-acyl-sn-glycerol-3-phosphate acyltransferase n=1 Tax=Acinetobacter higginsii TaxID=70347 RepID=UPI001F4A5378|nr:1-acyl-sn-glycerol-3-phosphate acyltransferase [Acinetobacter higginsii]MCH7305876.1 1-acyl-sn-glycerol-3-phosphate acyltransferase [Acinetobacter higginsii]